MTKKQADDEGEKKQKAVKVESKPKPKQKPKPIVAKPQSNKPKVTTRRKSDAEEYRQYINDPRTNGRLMAMLNDSDDDGDDEF